MSNWLEELGLALLIIAVGWLLSRLSRLILQWLTKKLTRLTETHLDETIVTAGQFPLQMAILVGAIDLGVSRIGSIPEAWLPEIGRVFFAVYALLVFLFFYRLVGGIITWYGREVAHKTDTELDDQFLGLFRYVAQIALTITVVIIVLGRYGIEVSALVTTLGIGSLAVALAAQETLSNMLAGFTIMVDRPFMIGDRVEIQDIGTWGDVVEIGLRSTRILTRDNRLVSVPNQVIGNGLVVNYSNPNTVYRVETQVGVAYGTDIEMARQVMITAISEQDWVMQEKRIEALFLSFGDAALNFTVRCWIENYVETRRIVDKMNTVLYQALTDANIEIPYPQLDMHLVSSEVPLTAGNGSQASAV